MTEVAAVVFVIDDDGRFANHLTTQMSMRECSSRSGRGGFFVQAIPRGSLVNVMDAALNQNFDSLPPNKDVSSPPLEQPSPCRTSPNQLLVWFLRFDKCKKPSAR